MEIEPLTKSDQENVLTILTYDDDNGKLVVNLVDPSLFEGDYRVIAEKAVNYWKQYKQAPKNHTPDLVSDIIDDPHNSRKQTFSTILRSLSALSANINPDYVVDRLKRFIEKQHNKIDTFKAAQIISPAHGDTPPEFYETIREISKRQLLETDSGLRLTDIDRVIDYLEVQQAEFTFGIKELDEKHIVPTRGTAILIIGGSGRGKSWALIHLGKRALLQRKKVLHITLEMSEEQVAQRYYQSLFSVTKRNAEVQIKVLDLDKRGKIVGLVDEIVKPDFTFTSDIIREELETHIDSLGTKMKNLIIKRFSSLTINQLDAYIDNLEMTENFKPDMLILDYLGLLQINMREARLSLGQEYKNFRGLLIERNMAGITAQQSSKLGVTSGTVKTTNVAEDWSLIGTSDVTITISSTDMEMRYGLCRLYVGKARDEVGQFGVLLTQSFDIGQFALESAYLGASYWELQSKFPKDEHDNDENEDDDDDSN